MKPTVYKDKDWLQEPYSRGCFTGTMQPGTLTKYGEHLRAPIGRIHWAGTETSTVWTGYIEGAIESGERVTEELLKELK